MLRRHARLQNDAVVVRIHHLLPILNVQLGAAPTRRPQSCRRLFMAYCQFEGCGKEIGFRLRIACSSEHAVLIRKLLDRERKQRWRTNVLMHYGNKCACCGETRREFLALDHKYGNGQRHRKQIGGGSNGMYRWAVRNNFPDIFRVLCHNCNMSIGCLGYCPHQREIGRTEGPCIGTA